MSGQLKNKHGFSPIRLPYRFLPYVCAFHHVYQMSLAFLMFAFLATGVDGEIRNVQSAEARAADANPHHQCSFFPPLAPNFIFNVGVHNDDDENVTDINPYPTAFPYGNGMVLHFYQQQESSTTKTVHRVINKGLKAYV